MKRASSGSLAEQSGAMPTGYRMPQVWLRSLWAAGLAILAALGLRFAFGWPSPAELFGDQLTMLIPLPVFARLLELFGHDAKHWFYGMLLLGEGLLTAAAGVAYLQLRRAVTRHWPAHTQRLRLAGPLRPAADVGALVLFLWLLSAGIFAPVIGGGFFGAGLTGGVHTVFGAELAPHLVYAYVFLAAPRRARATRPSATAAGAPAARLSRRRLLGQAGFALAVVAGGAVAWDFISGGLGRLLGMGGSGGPDINMGSVPEKVPPPTPTYGSWTPVAGQTTETTSTERFYYVSKNLVADPTVDVHTWRLFIDGLVEEPYSLTYDELRALPRSERFHTLECISNEVGGDLMSTADFTGVSLADVLRRAELKPGASEVIFRAADDYSDRLHLSQALDPRSLIVYLINGEPLPRAHGFPARLLIPDLYGMKNGKWLTSLTVGSGDYTGYWEQRGWTREARVKTMARIDVPREDDLLVARPTIIAGVAFAGERGIGQVDVSTDGGETFHPATFHPASLRRPLGPLTWVLWQLPWTPRDSGRYVIIVRAIDLEGNVQSPGEAPPLPDGSSGYHRISVLVR